MKSKERLEKTLQFQKTDRPPHFECAFELVEEAFGLRFPSYDELYSADRKTREVLFGRMAEIYARTVERYHWDAIVLWMPGSRDELQYDFIPFLQRYIGNDIPIINDVWSSFVSLETVKDYMQFSIQLVEAPAEVHEWAKGMLKKAKIHAQRSIDAGVYGIIIANDSAFNSGPFLSPVQHAEFCTPYVKELIDIIRSQGVKTGYHTDGNLMKIMDQIVLMRPDFLHSIDPMAGMDIKIVKKLTEKKFALMGNVQCDFLQDGPDDKIISSAKYCIDNGAPGGGYIFSSSNTIFKGLPLRNYEVMLDYYWKRYKVDWVAR